MHDGLRLGVLQLNTRVEIATPYPARGGHPENMSTQLDMGGRGGEARHSGGGVIGGAMLVVGEGLGVGWVAS